MGWIERRFGNGGPGGKGKPFKSPKSPGGGGGGGSSKPPRGRGRGGTGTTNPNFSNVLFQIQDNENGDESSSARVLTYRVLAARIGGFYDCTGSSASRITLPQDDAFGYAGDYTIEGFQYSTAAYGAQQRALFAFGGGSPDWSNYVMYHDGGGGTVEVSLSETGNSLTTPNGIQFSATSFPLVVGVEFDWCLERKGTKTRLYWDGVMIASSTDAGGDGDLYNSPRVFVLSGLADTTNNFGGRVKWKATRITGGIALYDTDGSYTVPSLPLPAV